MRTVLFLLLILIVPIKSFASPAVGDKSVYSGEAVLLGQPVVFQMARELTVYDSTLDQYKQVDTTVQNGSEPKVTEKWVKTVDLWSDFSADYLLVHCIETGGALETVLISAGQFQTCRFSISSSDDFMNYGKVPFGLVRLSAQGWKMELISFSRGKNI